MVIAIFIFIVNTTIGVMIDFMVITIITTIIVVYICICGNIIIISVSSLLLWWWLFLQWLYYSHTTQKLVYDIWYLQYMFATRCCFGGWERVLPCPNWSPSSARAAMGYPSGVSERGRLFRQHSVFLRAVFDAGLNCVRGARWISEEKHVHFGANYQDCFHSHMGHVCEIWNMCHICSCVNQ